MGPESFEQLTNGILHILTIIAGVFGALWAYTKFVIERGLLPAIQLDLECKRLGDVGDDILLDLGVNLNNLGSATLVARWLLLDVRYLRADDPIEYLSDSPRVGRLKFPRSLVNDVADDPRSVISGVQEWLKRQGRKPLPDPLDGSVRGFPLLPYDTFVQPKVAQRYSFVTKLPKDTTYILIRASFEYAQKPRRLQNVLYRLSRRLGLIHYSLQHVNQPHTVEHVFKV